MSEQELEKHLHDKRTFEALATGSVYKIPTYKVVPNVGIEKTQHTILIPFVRGSKIQNENEMLPVTGVIHETLLAMILKDLGIKNEEFPNTYTEKAIEYIANALALLEDRQRDRNNRNVQGTYHK